MEQDNNTQTNEQSATANPNIHGVNNEVNNANNTQTNSQETVLTELTSIGLYSCSF